MESRAFTDVLVHSRAAEEPNPRTGSVEILCGCNQYASPSGQAVFADVKSAKGNDVA